MQWIYLINICYFFFVKLNFDNNIDKKKKYKKIIFNIYIVNYLIDFEYSEKYLSKILITDCYIGRSTSGGWLMKRSGRSSGDKNFQFIPVYSCLNGSLLQSLFAVVYGVTLRLARCAVNHNIVPYSHRNKFINPAHKLTFARNEITSNQGIRLYMPRSSLYNIKSRSTFSIPNDRYM